MNPVYLIAILALMGAIGLLSRLMSKHDDRTPLEHYMDDTALMDEAQDSATHILREDHHTW